jgi:Na+/melibiose symporter-like transporter
MEENNKELPELKTIYDELWSDARTLAKDLKKSIAVYLYAAYVTLIIAFSSLLNAIPFFIQIGLGKANLFSWAVVLINVVCVAIVLGFAAKLFSWHRHLVMKYSKLIEMERKIGAK